MKNMFNKANTPYLVSSTLAIATFLASGVFAAAPYAGFLGVGLPFIIGGAVFSALIFALSAAVISKNKTTPEKDAQLASQAKEIQDKDRAIFERDTQLASKDRAIFERDTQLASKDRAIFERDTQLASKAKEIQAKDRAIFEKSKELTITSSYLDAQSVKEKAKMQKQLDKKVEYIINSDEDAERVHQERKERNREEVLDSEALSNLFREKPKSNVVAKEVKSKANQDVKQFRDKVIISLATAFTSAVMAPAVIASAFIAPVSMPIPTAELSGQQTSFSQANGNSTVNSSSAYHVPNPQVVLENKANEYEQTLHNAFEGAKNNFGASQSFFPEVDNGIDTSKRQGTLFDSVTLKELTREIPPLAYSNGLPRVI